MLVHVLATGQKAWLPKRAIEFGDSIELGEVFVGFVESGIWEEKLAIMALEKACVRRYGKPRVSEWIPPKLPRHRGV